MSIFYFITFLTILFALLVVLAKNPVHSVLYLVLTFFTLTAHYVLLNAQFLAIVNFIVYMGAIMVLFLFVVMLLDLNKHTEFMRSLVVRIVGAIAAGSLLVTFVAAVRYMNLSKAELNTNTDLGMIKTLGNVLFNQFLLPFELSSVLLLSAMVGALLLAKKETKQA